MTVKQWLGIIGISLIFAAIAVVGYLAAGGHF